MKKDKWLPQMMVLEVEDLGSTSDRCAIRLKSPKQAKQTSKPKISNVCIKKNNTFSYTKLSKAVQSEAKSPDLSVSVTEVGMVSLWMRKAPVCAYHFIRPVSTGRKLLNKASHVQSPSTIAISCHISSESMVVTCLTQIRWRTEVYNQSRQDV